MIIVAMYVINQPKTTLMVGKMTFNLSCAQCGYHSVTRSELKLLVGYIHRYINPNTLYQRYACMHSEVGIEILSITQSCYTCTVTIRGVLAC